MTDKPNYVQLDLAGMQRSLEWQEKMRDLSDKQKVMVESCRLASVVTIYAAEDLALSVFMSHSHANAVAEVMAEQIVELRKEIRRLKGEA